MKKILLQRIRDLREEKDLTQQQVATIFGMQITQYARYERGERKVPSEFIIQLSNYYNVSTDYILGITNNKKINR